MRQSPLFQDRIHRKIPSKLTLAIAFVAICFNAEFANTAKAQIKAADADPSFAMARVNPSFPNPQGKRFLFTNRHFTTINTNLNDLIAYAYGLHAEQIVGGPEWFGVDLFDIDAVPDMEGRTSEKQLQTMVQKLLAEHFKLAFHNDKNELPVYVITVADGGPKLIKSTDAPTALPAFLFRALGDLMVKNQTIADFAKGMQSGVMDKPVVDQTGLTGRYDFHLKWTPDDSQFRQFQGTGRVIRASTGNPNAPPDLYTAIQEQIGLKMEPGDALLDVIVIDYAEKPSLN